VDLGEVSRGLVGDGVPQDLVNELIAAYVEAKRRFYLGDHRPGEVEGGRFSEAAFRIVQHECGLKVTPIGKNLPSVNDQMLAKFENATGARDAARFHIPRALKTIYGIRNKRDVAHLADGIDPNLQDATLVTGNMDWVMAELVRLHHGVSANEAHAIIEDLVTKDVPAVQEIDGQPVILADLKPRERALLMLYRAGAEGTTLDELSGWLRTPRKADLKARLKKLDVDKLVLIHPKTGRVYLTDKGIRYVEEKKLAQPV